MLEVAHILNLSYDRQIYKGKIHCDFLLPTSLFIMHLFGELAYGLLLLSFLFLCVALAVLEPRWPQI